MAALTSLRDLLSQSQIFHFRIYFLKNFFLPKLARPIKPEPTSSMVAGSGTVAEVKALPAHKKTPTANNMNNKNNFFIINLILDGYDLVHTCIILYYQKHGK
jgi:hypothetical protein